MWAQEQQSGIVFNKKMDYEQLSKFFSGELTPEEKASLLASLEADEELRAEAARLKNSWAMAQLTDAPGDKELARKGWELFNNRIQKERTATSANNNMFSSLRGTKQSSITATGKPQKLFRLHPWRIIAAAASVAILVVASYFTFYMLNNQEYVTEYNTLTVPAGQTTNLTLSDGSEIWLNACSKLVYPEKFTSKTREIQLEGEGLFNVKSNKKKPFIVKTGLIDVVATGTQFNVSAYPDDKWVSTALIEGVVKLQSEINNQGFELKSGQIAIYDKKEQHIIAKNIDTDRLISWTRGEYHFDATSLEDITKSLERYFQIVFEFEDEALKQRKFTGTFYHTQSIETIMRVIETSTDMQYRINDKVIYIK